VAAFSLILIDPVQPMLFYILIVLIDHYMSLFHFASDRRGQVQYAT